MTDSTLKQAIKEAYASAPSNVIIYHTLELRHPSFSSPIRVVQDKVNLTATLEATAPANPGESVLFQAFAFDFDKPEVGPNGVPQIQIELDNVDRSIVANIEAAVATMDLVHVTYREYISTDLTGPQNDPPIHATLTHITADVFRVKATAGFVDLINRRFPNKEYDSETFPGLL